MNDNEILKELEKYLKIKECEKKRIYINDVGSVEGSFQQNP